MILIAVAAPFGVDAWVNREAIAWMLCCFLLAWPERGGAAAEGEAAVMATLVTSSMSSPLCLTWVTTGRASRH